MDQDIIDTWKDLKIAAANRRAANRVNSASFLTKQGVPFESKNNGAHIVISLGPLRVDFWPGTGLWRASGLHPKEGRGVFRRWAYLEHCSWVTLRNNMINPPPLKLHGKRADMLIIDDIVSESATQPRAPTIAALLAPPASPASDDTPPWD